MSNQYEKVDFLEFLNGQEEKRNKANEIRQQMQKDLAQIEAKYQDILEEYRPARERMDKLLNAFNADWDTKLHNYQKEVKALKSKYRKVIKSL